ncbi:hypothetical protein ACOMHN_049694 [Nucella lapillus]
MADRGQRLQTDANVQHLPDFRSAVMEVDNNLHDEDVNSLKFLCQGLVVGSKLKRVDSAHKLISLLESANLVREMDFFLLADLLQYIQRIDVLESIGYEEREVILKRHHQGSKVNPFYVLLFQIAEDLAEEDVRKASYMYGKVPRSQKVSSGVDLFTVMVHHQTITPDNVDLLLTIFQSIERQDIVELINRYTASQGQSVMEDLIQSFIRAMTLRGLDVGRIGDTLDARPQPHPQDLLAASLKGEGGHSPGGLGGRHSSGLGPSVHDRDINDRPPLPLPSQVSQGPSSIINNPPSIPPISPSAPPPSLPTFSNTDPSSSGSDASVPQPPPPHIQPPPPPPMVNPLSVMSRPYLPPLKASKTMVRMVVLKKKLIRELEGKYCCPRTFLAISTILEGFENYEIPWPVLDILSRNIPEEYWPKLSSSLGVPVTSDWSNTRMDRNHKLAVLKRWLDLPETRTMDSVRIKVQLVQALASSGSSLMAPEIAHELNIDFHAIMQESMSTQQGSAIDENDVASTGSAVPESMNMNQPASLGNLSLVPRARQISLQPSPIPFYRMDRLPRGICLIINNRDFYKDPHKMEAKEMVSREGTNVDRDKLKATFEQLNFHVMTQDNCKDSDMLQLVHYASSQNHQDFDCFVCCILTHGIQGALYGVNGMTVPIRDLTAPFRTQACPSLADKPKLFFLQACQGRDKQGGHASDMQTDCVMTDSPPELIPNESDFLLGYATVPGFVSYRSKTRGSWYITKLTENLNKHAFDHDVLDILTLVNYEVGKGDALIEGGQYKQSPAPMYSLRKKLIFARPF